MSDTALRYLLEAVNAGSMRAASDRIGVAPSSISRMIAQLEGTYGMALIEKGRRDVRLTEAGHYVIEYYRNQLSSREALTSRLQGLRSINTGNVTLAVGEGFLSAAFTDLINEFRTKNPQITLTLRVGGSQDIVKAILQDEAHMGLVFQVEPEIKIRVRSTTSQPLMAIVAAGHPLAHQAEVTMVELAQQSLCLMPREFRIRQILSHAEERSQVFLEPAITTNSILVQLESVRSGGCVTILPQLTVWTELRDRTLVSVPIADESIEKTNVSLILRTGRQLEGAPARLLNSLETKLRHWARNPLL
jgi:DNA-binding transcriptional LysR family regulator